MQMIRCSWHKTVPFECFPFVTFVDFVGLSLGGPMVLLASKVVSESGNALAEL